MFDYGAEQQEFVDERWKVVVQEEGPLDAEVWQEVHQIATEEGEADGLKVR